LKISAKPLKNTFLDRYEKPPNTNFGKTRKPPKTILG
jgi:hypothetical protein